MTKREAADQVKEMMSQGKLTTAEANVFLIKLCGVHVVKGRIPQSVRTDLNAAVKAGNLGRIKKDGLRPEVYFNINNKEEAMYHHLECERQIRIAVYGATA